MTKYFIENDEREWLTDPEEAGDSWTRDPYKAWAFEPAGKGSGIRAQIMGSPDAHRVIEYLSEEGCFKGAGCHITEQEFYSPLESIEDLNKVLERMKDPDCRFDLPGSPGSTYHVSRTEKQQFNDMLMTGRTVVKITPGK